MNKQIVLLAIFILLLSSCAPNATQNAAATSVATVASTFTPALTATSTVIPTPTNTPDPSMPKGTIGHDSIGSYVDTQVNGRTERFYNITLTDSLGKVRYHGWVSNHVTGGDLLDGGITMAEKNQWVPAGWPMYFYDQFGVPLPYVSHIPIDPSDDGKYVGASIYNGLYDIRFSNISRIQMSQNYDNGTIKVPFTMPNGKTYIWNPGPEVNGKKAIGIEFYAIPWADTDPVTNPDFFQTPEDKQFGNAIYRWTVFTKPDGTLIILAAVQNPAQLTEVEFAEWTLNPIGIVVENETLPSQADLNRGWVFNGYPSNYVSGAVTTPINYRGLSHSFFDLQPNP